MGLIPNKIALPHATPCTPRQRLLDHLSEGLQHGSVTIITGRAGTGKTVLAADFARRCGRCVAWYKVDAPEADLRVFLPYLMASVAAQRPRFRAPQFSPPLNEARLTRLAEALVYELQKQDEPLLVALDDLHLIYDTDWVVPFFHRLLPLLPLEVHLFLLCRSLPPAPLWRLRSKQRLCVVDEAALAFTAEEAVALFAAYGLDGAQAQQAWAQTRGRAAALCAEAERATLAQVAA